MGSKPFLRHKTFFFVYTYIYIYIYIKHLSHSGLYLNGGIRDDFCFYFMLFLFCDFCNKKYYF